MSDATHDVRTDEAEHRADEAEHRADEAEHRADETEGGEEVTDEEAADEYDHLDDVEDGSGCTEIWEHLSEQRDDD